MSRIARHLAWVVASVAVTCVSVARVAASDVVGHGPVGAATVRERVPDGVSTSDWSGIRAAYEANRHAAFAVDGGYQARNPGQRWVTRFNGRGFVTTPDSGAWSWGLELVSYDVAPANSRCNGVALANSSRCQPTAPIINQCGQRIEYDWDDTLTEWYINDRRGLEHGFTVQQRPHSSALRAEQSRGHLPVAEATGNARAPSGREFGRDSGLKHHGNRPLQLTLAVRGNLRPRISGDGRNVSFVDASGAAVVNYNGLTAFDATGAPVPAWFEISDPNSSFPIRHSSFLRIVIDDAEAVYPLTIDPIAQQAYLKASNTHAIDLFGSSVAASADTVVVGAAAEDSSAIGVNGNGADNFAQTSGAAYVFVRDAGGLWSQQAYLKASNTNAEDQFGGSVAISGDTVVVGARFEASSATGVNGNQADNGFPESGAAYVFVRDAGGVWSQQAYLKASNTEAFDEFAWLVAASGDTVVIGAKNEDSNTTGVNSNQADNSAAESGAAYVFVRNGTTWSQQAYLKASNTDAGDVFGISVAASSDAVVVGAAGEDSVATGVDGNQSDNFAQSSGAAYVFVRDAGGVWSQQAYLKASNTDAGDQFGGSVAISGDTLVVAARLEDSSATGVNGNEGDNGALDSGAAYVFVCDAMGNWSQQAYLKASNTDTGDSFGSSVAASGDVVVVGAFGEDSSATGVNGNEADNNASFAGAAYVFVRDAEGVWSQRAYLKASNTDTGDRFGTSVSASGDTVTVAAISEDSSATGIGGDQADNSASSSGAAYVFTICPLFGGDMNCDCAVDPFDVEPFVQALLDPDGYAAAHPGCDILNADLQPDGNVDAGDAQAFVGLLVP
jgi:hypothetical protein